ncbi:restriction endonuclease subunit S [Desulfopila aestuarii]|uniref:Type I restriction enzyme, S subunit n=1 Tax=Desulfopila aestuarii DSM 18488 TaxID=1121416 RepID=A0A1M7YK40_9BACT|nr:restriction endonuclease subunit S [Desulfopila aestuarii]SHO52983.1 type I restriction enzyme, S subunit [Desulfopila aestuarii DSM 18488]
MSNWPIMPLIEAADIASGITLGRKTKETDLFTVPYLRVANVQDGHLDLDEIKQIEVTRSELNKWRLAAGDLLLTEGGDLDKLGRGTCWREELPLCIHQNHIFRVRLELDTHDPEFVAYQVGSDYGKAYFLKHAKKTTGIASINKKVLSVFPLISPPLKEQRQIAACLKAQLAEVDKARQAAEAQLRETTKLADAIVFGSIRSGKTTKHNLGEVLQEVKRGIGDSWADYPVLGATRDGLAPAKEPPGKKPERYKPVFPGTVFYNPMRILIGSIALVDDDDTPGITSPDYVALQGRSGMVDSRWFYYWLRSPLGEQCILSLARGAVRERMLFNRLAEGEIELPDYDVQVKASAALAALKPMRHAIESKINDINILPQKILAQAFEM